ncbi:MAG: hypothetical protein MJY44_05715, partial [Bacteroidales bacterium]|nr:hypothetical protein [Bacteroidales bacterium]
IPLRNQRSRFFVLGTCCTFQKLSLFKDLSILALKKPASRLMANPSLSFGDCKGNHFFLSGKFFCKILCDFFAKFLCQTCAEGVTHNG